MPIENKGWEIQIKRTSQARRKGTGFARTISSYQVFHDGKEVDGLSGNFVERQGPGDNSETGVDNHRRIAPGRYPLSTHASPKKNNAIKYKTIGYDKSPDIGALPRPAILFLDTGSRGGILIHPGNGYIWSIGCFNPGRNLKTAADNLKFSESRPMVIALIDDMKNFLGDKFPKSNGEQIPTAFAVVEGDPK
jgi:uncharacterized protein DUF5675